MILIYDDGIHNNSHIMTAIEQIMPDIPCRFCTHTSILNGALNQASLLIMPGGADLYYCEKLNGTGNRLINDFVTNGGSYLGICAGAYYACTSLDWHDGEISGTRELAFYRGTATGPIYEWIENKENIYNGSWMYPALIKVSETTFSTEYHGGPIFSEPLYDDITVLARYNELNKTPPAIIHGIYGKGQYILSSSHIERFGHILHDRLYKHLNPSYEWEEQVINKLMEHTENQKILFKNIILSLLSKI